MFTRHNHDLIIIRNKEFKRGWSNGVLTSSKNQCKLARKTSKKELKLLTVAMKICESLMMTTAVYKVPSLGNNSIKEELIEQIFIEAHSTKHILCGDFSISISTPKKNTADL